MNGWVNKWMDDGWMLVGMDKCMMDGDGCTDIWIPLGIACGLFFGKQIGVFLFSWVMIKTGVGRMPENTNWMQLYATSILCGIGFTMSLFIGTLAFSDGTIEHNAMLRIGVLSGSVIAGIVGYFIFHFSSKQIIQE